LEKEEKMRIAVVSFAAVVVLWAVSPAFSGMFVLDQYQESDNYATSMNSPGRIGQSFTAGLSGLLDHIDVKIDATLYSLLNVQITSTTTLDVPGAVLGSNSLASGTGAGWQSVDFLSWSITMTPGTQYAIVLAPTSSHDEFFGLYYPDSYSGGKFLYDIGSGWAHYNNDDLSFRTYVTPAPGAVLLAAIGLSVAGWRLRRKTT
jgi:hypothetical protein